MTSPITSKTAPAPEEPHKIVDLSLDPSVESSDSLSDFDLDLIPYIGFFEFLSENKTGGQFFLLPFIEHMPRAIAETLCECLEKKPNIFDHLLDDVSLEHEKEKLQKIKMALYLRVDHFKQKGDSVPLISFLKKAQELIEKNNLQTVYDYSLFQWYIDILKTKRLDLLVDCCTKRFPELRKDNTPVEKLFAAWESFSLVAQNICVLFDLEQLSYNEVVQKIKSEFPVHDVAIPPISAPTVFTQEEWAAIHNVYISLHLTSREQFADFRALFFSLSQQSSSNNCNKIELFQGKQVRRIQEAVNLLGPKIKRNAPFFENFLSYVKEMSQFFDPPAGLVKNCAVLKDFYAYIHLGNCEALKQKINQKNRISPEQLKRALVEEVTTFSQKLRSDTALLLKVLSLHKQNPQANKFRIYWSCYEHYLNQLSRLKSAFLDGSIPFAESRAGTILNFLQKEKTGADLRAKQLLAEVKKAPSAKLANREKTKSKEKQKSPRETTTSSSQSNLQLRSLSISTHTTTAQPEIPPVTLTPLQQMQEARAYGTKSLQELKRKCTGFGAKDSLERAQSHYNDMLCVMSRFLEQAKNPSKQRISTFILQCIQHGFLASEQLLSALGIEGNHIQNLEELRPALSHNLSYLLLNCPLMAGPVHPHLRQWVCDSQLGEFWIRDIQEYDAGHWPLQKFVGKTQQFAQGNTAFTAQELISDAVTFMENSVKLYKHLYKQFDALQPAALHAENSETRKKFKENFLSSCDSVRTASKQLPPLSLQNLPLDPSLTALRLSLGDYAKNSASPGIRYGLSEVTEHFLPLLEVEMQASCALKPFEARLHLRAVLRYDQWTAEKVMRALLNEFHPESNFEKKDHNLSEMVMALGMKQEDFTEGEWHWLTSGQIIHHLARYFTSHQAVQHKYKSDFITKLEKAFETAHQIASKYPIDGEEAFGQALEISEKGLLAKFEGVKAVAYEDFQLMQSILHKVLKHCLPAH